MDLGNTADIVSAGCNIVMAGAAIGAYLIAKDYFTDMVKRDGYEITKKIQLELLPQLGETFNLSEINLLDQEVPRYINGQNSILDDDDKMSSNSPIAIRDINSLSESLVKVQNKLYRTGEDTIYDKTLNQFGKYLSGGRHLKNFFEYKPK